MFKVTAKELAEIINKGVPKNRWVNSLIDQVQLNYFECDALFVGEYLETGDCFERIKTRDLVRSKVKGMPRGAWAILKHENNGGLPTYRALMSDGSRIVSNDKLEHFKERPGWIQVFEIMLQQELEELITAYEQESRLNENLTSIKKLGLTEGQYCSKVKINDQYFPRLLIDKISSNGMVTASLPNTKDKKIKPVIAEASRIRIYSS